MPFTREGRLFLSWSPEWRGRIRTPQDIKSCQTESSETNEGRRGQSRPLPAAPGNHAAAAARYHTERKRRRKKNALVHRDIGGFKTGTAEAERGAERFKGANGQSHWGGHRSATKLDSGDVTDWRHWTGEGGVWGWGV